MYESIRSTLFQFIRSFNSWKVHHLKRRVALKSKSPIAPHKFSSPSNQGTSAHLSWKTRCKFSATVTCDHVSIFAWKRTPPDRHQSGRNAWSTCRLLRTKMSKSNQRRIVYRFRQLGLKQSKRKNMENDTYLYAEVTALQGKYSSLLVFVLSSQNASWRCCTKTQGFCKISDGTP